MKILQLLKGEVGGGLLRRDFHMEEAVQRLQFRAHDTNPEPKVITVTRRGQLIYYRLIEMRNLGGKRKRKHTHESSIEKN